VVLDEPANDGDADIPPRPRQVVGSLQIPGKQLEKRALLALLWGGESAKQPGMINVRVIEKSSIVAYEGEPDFI
jgi:hypothetical protein